MTTRQASTDRRGVAPPTFTDTIGRKWTLALDFDVYRRVLTNHEVDLCDIVYEEQKSLKQLDQPIVLVDVLYEICKLQAMQLGVNEMAFAQALDMPAVADAQRKLVDEMIFFSRSHPRAAIVREAVTAADEAERVARLEVERQIPQMREAIKKMVPSALGDLAGSSPGSSASTPGNGPSVNSHGPQVSGSENGGITRRRSSPSTRKPTATQSAAARRSRRGSSTRSSK